MNILNYLAQNFYSSVLMILVTVAALVISIRYYSRHRNLRIFTYYIAFSLLQSTTDIFALLFVPAHGKPTRIFPLVLALTTGLAFMLFEFIICNLFILHYITSPLRRRIIRINALGYFVLLILTFTLASKYIHILPYSSLLLESVFLVPPCLFYFYELFQTVNLQPLKEQPSFWVITGILFLNASSIPLQLTEHFLGSYSEAAYTLNYILYIVLFILLIKAYLCTPEKLTNA